MAIAEAMFIDANRFLMTSYIGLAIPSIVTALFFHVFADNAVEVVLWSNSFVD